MNLKCIKIIKLQISKKNTNSNNNYFLNLSKPKDFALPLPIYLFV